MKNKQLSTVLFSLALIAALTLAAFPAPAYALSASAHVSSAPSIQAAGLVNAPALAVSTNLVCHRVVIWRHGVRIVVWRCHKPA